MPRRRSPALTDGELRIMRTLWDRGSATVGDIVDRVEGSPKPAYNTVLTMLRILETKGYVRHEKDGRAFVYAPTIGRSEARRSALSHLLYRFFDGSPELLVLDLLGHDDASPEELGRLRRLIEESARGTARSTAERRP
jgi:BlaI family transcriptional regulator, penicillinase repressor